MDKRLFFCIFIFFFILGCTSTPIRALILESSSVPSVSHTPSSARGILEAPTKTFTPTAVAPTSALLPTTTSDISLTATDTVRPSNIETEFPEPTTVYRQVTKPSTPLDQKSYQSVLEWIKYGFANQDLSVIEDLASGSIRFGISEAEYTDILTEEELMKMLASHLAKETQCLAYTFGEGEINALEVFTVNWEPNWDYMGRNTDDLIFFFSDQYTPDVGLSLIGVEVPNYLDHNYVEDLFERMCFE